MRKFLQGFRFAGQGIAAGLRGQINIKVMLFLAAVAVVLSLVLKISLLEWALIVGVIGLVLSLELLNTAGEKVVDILSPHHDPRYGQVKDILAGAVLIASLAAAVVGALVFIPKWL
ncbi:MAG: diacylglycerol kinase family protein [Gemmatimonadales bacterium]|nr:diacylglycerol kinase family protein [Gemmatimonadales bacterium]